MLTELCQELHNWFNDEIIYGEFVIDGGNISLPFLQEGQYFRIAGSVFNDGVHQYGATSSLHDETFDGAIWPMRIPQAVIDLSARIDKWCEDNAQALSSPYQSESWGGYSYSLRSGSGESGTFGWQSTFARELNRWRKMQNAGF